jgi:hypothetical protein
MLDNFGKLLIEKVRDETYVYLNAIINKDVKGDAANYIRKIIAELNPKSREELDTLILFTIDCTIHNFLSLLDNNEGLDLVIQSESSTDSLKSYSDGLAEELNGSDGWVATFSKQSKYEDAMLKNVGKRSWFNKR